MENNKAVEKTLDPASGTQTLQVPETAIAKAVESDNSEEFARLREAQLKGKEPESVPAKTEAKEETPKAEEPKTDGPPKTPDPASDKPNPQEKRTADSEVRKLKRQLAERDQRLAELQREPVRKPEPEPVKPPAVQEAKRPRMADFGTIAEWQDADDKWLETREAKIREGVQSEFTTRETKAAQEKAQRDLEEQHKTLNTIADKLDKELGNWSESVAVEGSVGRSLNQKVLEYALGKQEVGMRGLYIVANLPDDKLAEFMALPQDEQQAEILWHGKQKPIAKAPLKPPPGAPTREPGAPPKEAGGNSAPHGDVERAAVESDDTEAFARARNAKLKAAGRRY